MAPKKPSGPSTPSKFAFRTNYRIYKGNKQKIADKEVERDEFREANRKGKTRKAERDISDLQTGSRDSLVRIFKGSSTLAAILALGITATVYQLTKEEEPKPTVITNKMDEGEPLSPELIAFMGDLRTKSIQDLTRIHSGHPEGKLSDADLLSMQKYWKNLLTGALRDFQGADPEIAELIKFVEDHAYFSIPSGPVGTKRVNISKEQMEAAKNPKSFEIVFMPEKPFAKVYPNTIMIQNRTMRILTSFKSEEWLAIQSAHALSMMKDWVAEGKDLSDSKVMYSSKAQAHLLEMRLLKSWNPLTYATLIELGVPMLKQGKGNELKQLIVQLYSLKPGNVSPLEFEEAINVCLIAVLFEDAMQRGAKEQDLGMVYETLATPPPNHQKAPKKRRQPIRRKRR